MEDELITVRASDIQPRNMTREEKHERVRRSLLTLLARGPASVKEVEMHAWGLKIDQLRRVKQEIGAVSFRQRGVWFWVLPARLK